MGLRIEPKSGTDLAMFGDVEAVVSLPDRCRNGRFSLAFSDGTLVIGTHRGGSRTCLFEVAVAGTSRVKIDRSSGAEALLFDGPIDWMLLGSDTEMRRSNSEPETADQLRLDLRNGLISAVQG